MCIPPKLVGKSERIDARLFPPSDFVTGPVHFAMVGPAQGDNEHIAHLAPEGSGLREPKVMRIRWLAPAYQARAFGDPFDMNFVAKPTGFWERQHTFVDLGRSRRD